MWGPLSFMHFLIREILQEKQKLGMGLAKGQPPLWAHIQEHCRWWTQERTPRHSWQGSSNAVQRTYLFLSCSCHLSFLPEQTSTQHLHFQPPLSQKAVPVKELAFACSHFLCSRGPPTGHSSHPGGRTGLPPYHEEQSRSFFVHFPIPIPFLYLWRYSLTK